MNTATKSKQHMLAKLIQEYEIDIFFLQEWNSFDKLYNVHGYNFYHYQDPLLKHRKQAIMVR